MDEDEVQYQSREDEKPLHPFAVPAEPPPPAPQLYLDGPPDGPRIMDWLDREMKGRLSAIDEKLVSLSQQVGICVDRLSVPHVRVSQRMKDDALSYTRRQHQTRTNRHSVSVKDGSLVSMHPDLKGLQRQNTRSFNQGSLGVGGGFMQNKTIAERGTYLRFAGSQLGKDAENRDPPAVGSMSRPSVRFQETRSEISTPAAPTKESVITNGLSGMETGIGLGDRDTYVDDDLGMDPMDSTTSLNHKRQAITVQKHYPIAEKMAAFSQLPAAFKRDAVSMRERVWTFLDDAESSRWAMTYSKFEKGCIILACFISFLQTIEPPVLKGILAAAFETSFDVIFMLDCALRICVCPSCKGYLLSIYSWWDILSSSAFVLRASQGFVLDEKESTERTLLLCIVPVIRLMKMLRHFQQFQLLLDAFSLAFEALPVLLFTLLIITLTAASIIYMVEPRDNIDNFPKAIWLTIVTMTTVGYGDITPQNSGGSVVVAALVIGSVLFMAMPLGIIGGAFTQVWNDRDRILLIKRTRERLIKWGYAAEDIPVLFEVADADGTGEVDIDEFRCLMKNMKIGLANDRIVQLFQSFDNDCSGTIDAKEFIRNIFPSAYLDIFGNNDRPWNRTPPSAQDSPRETFAVNDGGRSESITSPPPLRMETLHLEAMDRSRSKQSDEDQKEPEPPNINHEAPTGVQELPEERAVQGNSRKSSSSITSSNGG